MNNFIIYSTIIKYVFFNIIVLNNLFGYKKIILETNLGFKMIKLAPHLIRD